MPKAEVGSTKYLNNKLKSKGLQRLRWYCQVCEKQCRDENGFRCHTMSESHVRQMQAIGANATKYISDYSQQFQRDFLQLLRTAHFTKSVHMNHFYQEYIGNKEHVHMNATRWPSLTEFAKHLGREGICRVEENDKGLHIAWIDNSPDALRRQEAIRKKERQDRGDEEREQKLIKEQIRRAEADAEAKGGEDEDNHVGELRKEDGEKIKLSFGPKSKDQKSITLESKEDESGEGTKAETSEEKSASPPTRVPTPPLEKVTLKMGLTSKPKNIFASAPKKNALSGSKVQAKDSPKRPMSEAERIMKEEIERKRMRDSYGGPGLNTKRPRLTEA